MKINIDNKYRFAAFNWLSEQVSIHGDVLPRQLLAEGFQFESQRITLLGPQGIWKPKVFQEYPISITTVIDGPYEDSFSNDNLLLYHYRGTDPYHRDNVILRNAMKDQIPLIYFHNIVKGMYHAIWPVFIVGDDPKNLTFNVAADDIHYIENHFNNIKDFITIKESANESRRLYITSTVRQRLHQRSFRERVLYAYHNQCAFCHLKHRELLDAAHIIPDNEPGGEPVVSNGLSLCKLHHTAFDKNILGVRTDYIIIVRNDILKEDDGPMLIHGLQELHEKRIILPSKVENRPNQDLLERRYKHFKKVS